MIFTASTVSDTKWKIIAAAMAEKAKPTVLERLAARKITIGTATQCGVASARWVKPERDQPKCQTAAIAVVPTSKPSVTKPILRPDGDVARADMSTALAERPTMGVAGKPSSGSTSNLSDRQDQGAIASGFSFTRTVAGDTIPLDLLNIALACHYRSSVGSGSEVTHRPRGLFGRISRFCELIPFNELRPRDQKLARVKRWLTRHEKSAA